MSAALYRPRAVAAVDAYASDPVVAEARSLRAAALGLASVTASLHDTARGIRTRLDGVATRGRLNREVIIADDDLGATAALVAVLGDVAPLRVVTDDRTAEAGLARLGVVVHVVHNFGELPGLVRRHHCAVAVVDVNLGGVNGAELVERMPRGPRVVLITSHDGARESLDGAARATQADAVVRTDTGGWADDLRARVVAALRDACG